MPITEHQKSMRQHHLGASEWSAILGRSQWRTRTEVFYDKTLPLKSDETTDSMSLGNWLENPLIDWACEQLSVTVKRNQFRVSDKQGVLSATHDAICVDKREGLECKFVGPLNSNGWGEEGSDEVPDDVNLQCQGQCYVSDLDVVWVPALIVTGFYPVRRMYRVPRNQEIIDICVPELVKFWHENVEKLIPPSLEPPSMDILKRVLREPESVIDLGDDAIVAWRIREASADAKREAEKMYEKATAACVMLLGTSEAGSFPDGSILRYATENAGARCDTKALLLNFPQAFAETCRETTRKMLRLKSAPKAKKGKQ